MDCHSDTREQHSQRAGTPLHPAAGSRSSAGMTADDIDLRFFPADGVSEAEGRDWRRIIAGAAADAPGTASLAFMRVDSAWLLLGLYRRGVGSAWSTSVDTATPLRRRVIDALRSAGKPVIEG